MSNAEIQEVADFMKAFSHPLRLQIINLLLDSERNVTDIVNQLGEKQCTVSMQLKFLMDRRILARRTEQKFVYYRLREQHVGHMLDMVQMGMLPALSEMA